ncbi:hypothetical protein AU193_01430 [Mycobacterium sp. GA-1285]|uniref:hypothetical protein n=1 Tax=Mycobacterium sp. GA-1285 TaxID=1772282 RepID=UPI0007487E45|nr:hypothetical protein [Mycobacterium sp. GA-1285]KUI23438.1 hypothetical protein AU193_01430 [Mycobacterium sp. GA-1285]
MEGGYDYADAFEVEVAESDSRVAEQFMRDALERSAPALRSLVLLVHRHVLRFRLGPLAAPDHVLGWRILTSEPDVVQLEAQGPIGRGVLVLRRVTPARGVLSTFVFFRHPVAPVIWTIVGPAHRRVAPYLMERTVSR